LLPPKIDALLELNPIHYDELEKIYRAAIKKHATALQIRDMLHPEVFASFFKCSFVRNPWDLQVSLYHYILEHPENPGYASTKDMGSF